MRLKRRVDAMEAKQPDIERGQPFLWGHGQPLAEALADAGLTLEDKPLFAIRLEPPGDVPDPMYEQDRMLLEH